jgi:FixJ family two-component response regulator
LAHNSFGVVVIMVKLRILSPVGERQVSHNPAMAMIRRAHLSLARDRARRENEKALGAIRARFASLTRREREIMIQVVLGRLSKQIAYDIGISEVTVKVHRSNLMRKMSVRSLPELGRMADKLKLVSEKT